MRPKRARKTKKDNVDEILDVITPKKPVHTMDTTVQELHNEHNQEFVKATYQAATYQTLTNDPAGAEFIRNLHNEGDRATLIREAAYAIQEQAFDGLMTELKVLAATIAVLETEKSGATCVNLFDVVQRMYIESIWLQRRIRAVLDLNMDAIQNLYVNEAHEFEHHALEEIIALGKYAAFSEADTDMTQQMFNDLSKAQIRSIQRNRKYRHAPNSILADEHMPSTAPDPQPIDESFAAIKIAETHDRLGDGINVSHIIDILTVHTNTPVDEIVERAKDLYKALMQRSGSSAQ